MSKLTGLDYATLLALADVRPRFGLDKLAFTPSPALAQAVMGQAQGGPPVGGDPAAGGMPPGMPPGVPPEMMAAGGAPPGMDPAAAAAAPAPAPVPAPAPAPAPEPAPNPLEAKVDQLIQLIQKQQGGENAGGASGTPSAGKTTSSVKIDPAHFHQMVHDIKNQGDVLTRIADAMGINVPASKLLSSPAPPFEPLPAPPAGDAAAAAQPAPSQIAVQLPSLPPAVAKAAAYGTVVGPQDGDLGRGRAGSGPSLVDRVLKLRKK